jgi:hypothetical protein
MEALARFRPSMATVLDWERESQFDLVMEWAEEAARHVGSVVIIPKVVDSVERIPFTVCGKPVVIGYSIPTKFGGTSVPVWELAGRRVHLLGGSPHRQMREYAQISGIAEVVSADGNMMRKMAVERCCYWSPRSCGREGRWPVLRSEDKVDTIYAAFRMSCEAIAFAWREERG